MSGLLNKNASSQELGGKVSFSLDAPGVQKVQFHNAIYSEEKNYVAIDVVGLEPVEGIVDYAGKEEYGDYQHARTFFSFKEKAIKNTQSFLNHLLEATGKFDEFYANVKEDSVKGIAAALNKTLKDVKFCAIFAGEDTWKETNDGEMVKYGRNNGIYNFGVTDPKTKSSVEIRHSVDSLDNYEKLVETFEFNNERRPNKFWKVKEAPMPTQRQASLPEIDDDSDPFGDEKVDI